MLTPELCYSPLLLTSPPATPFLDQTEDSTKSVSALPRIYTPSPDLSFMHEQFSLFSFDNGPSKTEAGADTSLHSQLPTSSLFNLDASRHSSHFPAGHKLNAHFVSKYSLEDELGSGGYGFVMTAKHRSEGCEVAVKFIIKEKVPESGWMEDEVIGRLPTEVMLLSFIEHENIVKCLDLFEDSLYFYLVQELHGSPWPKAVRRYATSSCSSSPSTSTPSLSPSASVDSLSSAGSDTPPPTLFQLCPEFSRRPSHDLFECIEQSEHKRLCEEQARYVFSQVVDAVWYLDTNGITHRDIKDENLVIDKNLKVKLIDFGSAIIVDPQQSRPYYTLFYGTAAYASPEILRKKAYQAAPAEIWTLGVLLSFLLTGASPFPTVKDAMEGTIVLVDEPDRLSQEALHLMRICLDPNPKTRATIGEVKEHPWLK